MAFSLPVREIKVMRFAEVSAVLLETGDPDLFRAVYFAKNIKKIYQGKCRGWKWMRCVEGIRYPSIGVPNGKARPPRGPFLSEKGFLTSPSFFTLHPCHPLPLATLSPLPIALPLNPASPVAPTSPLLFLLPPGPGPAVWWWGGLIPTSGALTAGMRADSQRL